MIVERCEVDPPFADVCVVGAGPVGLAIALTCEDLGLSVTLVEAGGVHADDAPAGAESTIISSQHHAPFDEVSRGGLGGTSAIWGGRCVPLDDIDFEERSFVNLGKWPISHAELKPYYRRAAEFLKCGQWPNGGEGGEAEEVKESEVIESVERWSAAPQLKTDYLDRLERSTRLLLVANARVTGLYFRENGTEVDYLRASQGERVIELRAARYVLAAGGLGSARLLLAARERYPHLFGGAEGPLGKYYQGHLTGHIALIRLHDRREHRKFMFLRDADGSYYRSRFQINKQFQRRLSLFNTTFWLDSLPIADAAHQSSALSSIYLALALLKLDNILLGEGTRSSAARHWVNIKLTWLLPFEILIASFRLIAGKLQKKFTLRLGGMWYLLRYHAEQQPSSENYVELTRDAKGAESLVVRYVVTDRDLTSVVKSHELLEHWLTSSGTGELKYLCRREERSEAVRQQVLDGYHQIGITRMSDTPSTGVVDRDCRIHGIENLYVGGTGVFPTGGQANPTFPAVSLGIRLAEHLGAALRAPAREREAI